MPDFQPASYKTYQWIVFHPDLLGGQLAIRGTRISVSLILECLANGMALCDINEAFAETLTEQILSEVLSAASDVTETFHVAA